VHSKRKANANTDSTNVLGSGTAVVSPWIDTWQTVQLCLDLFKLGYWLIKMLLPG